MEYFPIQTPFGNSLFLGVEKYMYMYAMWQSEPCGFHYACRVLVYTCIAKYIASVLRPFLLHVIVHILVEGNV